MILFLSVTPVHVNAGRMIYLYAKPLYSDRKLTGTQCTYRQIMRSRQPPNVLR